ncbi:type I-E CRISPR-associated protein Cas6/Cse3/CasE [Methylococcus sp. ANG]|uniref:type I-E CRISPR-associated protein Cas6/Cse3/CasE n=1 Tax=Methylococcus sp. ANG TaxID=3231903 RepID=UPI003459B1CC
MYFSRISVNPTDPAKVMEVLKANDYALHQMLWKLFPDDPETSRDFLFRHDEDQRWPVFYLVSQREPDGSDELLRVASKPYRPQLRSGETLTFSLRANPVHTRKTDDANQKKRKRDDVVMHLKWQYRQSNADAVPALAELAQEAGEQWLVRQGERNGFRLLSVRADNYRQARLDTRRRNIRFSTLDFTGLLQVTEPDVFAETLCKGIGPAKAFGCGLMLVRRI